MHRKILLSVLFLSFMFGGKVNASSNEINILSSGIDEVSKTRYIIWGSSPDIDNYTIIRKDISGNILETINIENNDSVLIYEEPVNKSMFVSINITTNDKSSENVIFKAPEVKNVVCNATCINYNDVYLTWNFIGDSLIDYSYNIYRDDILIYSGVTLNCFLDTNLELNSEHTYQIEPYYIIDNKVIAGSKSIKRVCKISPHESFINSASVEENNVKLEFSGDEFTTKYKIYRREEDSEFVEIAETNEGNYIDTVSPGKYFYCIRSGTLEEKWGSLSSEFEIIIEKPKRVEVPKPNIISEEGLTPILGDNDITVEQMVNYFNKNKGVYPTIYAEKGAATIEEFCQLVYEISENYNVRDSVVFAQIMCETGTLSFKGDVDAWQCNFSGFGATGGGVKGNIFESVEEGITAQVQHLRNYADKDYVPTEEMKDTRYRAYYSGKCPYVEWLSIPNNPYGVGWAMADNYGEYLKGIIEKIKL